MQQFEGLVKKQFYKYLNLILELLLSLRFAQCLNSAIDLYKEHLIHLGSVRLLDQWLDQIFV